MNQNETKNITVPIWEKYALTIAEAARYFGIGEKKLKVIASEYGDDGFIIQNGVKVLFKREKFSEWLDNVNTI